MKSYIAAAVLAAGANALVARDAACSFQLTASGGPGGVVGQLSDGQNRIGQGLPAATYTISNGGLTDGNGRGCILTPPTTQFQCDAGATPTGGFAIDCNGQLTYNGESNFVSCPTGDNGGFNIYTVAPEGQGGCVAITLSAGDACHSGCTSPPPPPPPASTCPSDLAGDYQFPHLIIPVSKSNPDTAYGSQYNGTVTSDTSSIFNFDIPASYAGSTCSLLFLFPDQSQLQTSSYEFSGPGAIDFAALDGVADAQTTYNNAPGVGTDFGVFTVAPGNSYNVASFPCDLFAGKAFSYELSSTDGTSLSYFQDYNPSPIGLYVRKC